MHADIAIVGGGILGTSLSYFLAHLNRGKKIVVVEQEPTVAVHTSGRNTGKVHAPYMYDPKRKRVFAKAAYAGFEMWRAYARCKGLAFKEDGVVEVALDEAGVKILETHIGWGRANGLAESEIEFWDRDEVGRREPEISCEAAIFCSRDGSVDYGQLTRSLKEDSEGAGAAFVFNNRVIGAREVEGEIQLSLNNAETVHAGFVINAAGGEAIDIAHKLGAAGGYTDVHFRGEYWSAPAEYVGLTSVSVYSVPRFPDYPFLDPHWIVRADGSCEVGPNAVPVFSPYGYDSTENIKGFVPKVLEMLDSGARKAIFDSQFQVMALSELASSLSKSQMIGRVKRFLPKIEPDRFERGALSGIRSSVINKDGKFEPDVILEKQERALSILNYNSPGASGVLPFCAYVIDQLDCDGLLRYDEKADRCGPWRFSDVVESMK